jgi:hypothetical protein
VRTYVRTRGQQRSLDYQFLGQAPDDTWWRDYHAVTDVERATILVRADGASWQAYIAGIRSARLDSVATPIQFNLVFAGDCGPAEDSALAYRAIIGAAADAAERSGVSIPGDLLDARLSAEDIERMLAAPGPQTAAEAAAAVCAAYGTEPAPAADETTPEAGNWIGGTTNPGALAAFAALTAQLLGGSRPGRALLLNLVDDEAYLDDLPQWAGVTGVLGARGGTQLGMEVRSLGKDQPPPHEETGPPSAGRPRLGRREMLILAGAVALAILIDWLIQPHH